MVLYIFNLSFSYFTENILLAALKYDLQLSSSKKQNNISSSTYQTGANGTVQQSTR